MRFKNCPPLALVSLLLFCSFGRADELPAFKTAQAETHLDVTIGGKPFTTYWFGPREDRPYVRPFFFPVYAVGEVEATSDQFSRRFKEPKGDHPHHTSMWVGMESINGVNHWIYGPKGDGKNSAPQRHLKFDAVNDNGFVERLSWNDLADKPIMLETRTVKFVAYPDGSRGIELTSAFTPADGAVTIGDAKDAGLLAVRVNPQISAHPTLTQSTGKTGEGMAGEKATWGKAAEWCDESGLIDGKPFGIAIFDAPGNPRFPTRWHVRAYGLMAANIFGLSDFDKSPKHTGDFTIPAGATATFRHLAVIHPGTAADAKLEEKYKAFTAENPSGQ